MTQPLDQTAFATQPDYTGPCHHLRPYDGAKKLVVFFGAKDLSFDRYNFFQTGRELPQHCLFLNNGANHWYQYGVPGLGHDMASTVAVIRNWAAALDATEIVTIGTSMGGYGAIQYGAALGARVLAFASDARLSDLHSQSAQHFTPAAGPPDCPDLCTYLAQTPTDVTLFAGERDAADLHAAQQLGQVAGVRVITLVGAGHIVPSYLAQRTRLVPLMRRFVSGKPIPVPPDAGRAVLARGYVAASYAAFCAAQDDDWDTCATQARAALEAYPMGEAASLLLGRALLARDDNAQAAQVLANTVATRPEDTDAKALLAQALRRCDAPLQARQLHAQIVAQTPGAHRNHYAIGVISLELGDLQLAAQSIRSAIRIAPKIKAYRDRLAQVEKRIAKDAG